MFIVCSMAHCICQLVMSLHVKVLDIGYLTVLSLIFRHEAELAAAAAQPLPDDDDDVFD